MASILRKFLCKKPFDPPALLKPVHVQGDHYHLQEIYDTLNAEYFEEEIEAQITWFGSKERKAKAHRLLGCYDFNENLIRIHRLLDNPIFPDYFISYVVYHEMLHEYLPPIEKWGRKRRIHHSDFKKYEERFSQYHLAKKWEKENKHLFFSTRLGNGRT